MTKTRWDKLLIGTVVQSAASGHSFIVAQKLYDNRGKLEANVLVRSVVAQLEKEWTVVSKEQLKRGVR